MTVTGENNDNGTVYQPVARMSNTSLVPDFGTHFSIASVGFYDEPSRTGCPFYFQVDTNQVGVADVAYLIDDDPTNGISLYSSITSTNQTTVQQAFLRKNGTYLKQNVFAFTQPMCRWISWQILGPRADDNWAVYGWFTAYEQKR